jgi:hypothetical protein
MDFMILCASNTIQSKPYIHSLGGFEKYLVDLMTSKLKLKKVKHVKQLVAALVEEAYNGKPIHQ